MELEERVRADFYAVVDRQGIQIAFDGIKTEATLCFCCDARPAVAYGLAKNFPVLISGTRMKAVYDYFLCERCLNAFDAGDDDTLANVTIQRKYAEGAVKTPDQEINSRVRLKFEFEMMRSIFKGRGMQRFTDKDFRLTYRSGFAPGTLTVASPNADAHAWLDDQRIVYLDEFKAMRREFCRRFSWAIPNREALEAIASHSPNGVIDFGAGRGYWTYLLRHLGVSAEAIDLDPYGAESRLFRAYNKWSGKAYCHVDGGGLKRLKRADHAKTLLFVWPPEVNDAAGEALRRYQGDVVAYVGEMWGCTGTPFLHNQLELLWTQIDEILIPTFYGFFDRLRIYRRR